MNVKVRLPFGSLTFLEVKGCDNFVTQNGSGQYIIMVVVIGKLVELTSRSGKPKILQ